uniref:DUF982 domain-containing protein n=2 Tax=Rhizobium rhizogenes TaxID=359 RepID=A0A7S4ZUQ0_RHIRH|nr:hypothetical protein pC5.8b_366 [Rhizobium rhizogenes]
MYWSAPVHIRVGTGFSEAVVGPEEALEYLTYRWPARRGPQYLEALRACSAANERQISLDLARDIFIAASAEAGMLD